LSFPSHISVPSLIPFPQNGIGVGVGVGVTHLVQFTKQIFG